ncbi:Acyl-CoA dehydrogenase/oxidase C-terminal [Acididesulfobacillus acetoxydans]|uniref:Acyl-CoA dehydrogenase member 9, mitochondrial n=1 Tax=Acididesulfobacillus acetoxydans TaxID=1561005 RepID=A0A8S0VX65_9FIRM|nr:acyl-CoA dehydrogenase family protein [Acididesulfobacillus acetoxydans]CAA7601633.1 Acyl-CoA dehydrogenase/oxidase C-terminal [Acididesulfobacillus acetoxydans]CEJ07120.1 Acyl-CoA dehydrogenase member 9, mitochondrial [Acididesulfobacillus acetoxydans]
MASETDLALRGGGFLLVEVSPDRVFIPEELNEDHLQLKRMTHNFVEKEVAPRIEELEEKKEGVITSLLRQAGDLGLLGLEVPEEFGGLSLDKYSTVVVGEEVPRGGSFAVAYAAHTGIGTLPIVYFGTSQQKAKYLPALASGEKIAAYCLTEPGSGSDALGAKTTAVLNAEGTHYILNGTKQFITNAGFADIFLVYAKVDGKLTNFIVERDMPGVSFGLEEKKMGIRGSSTRQVILEDVAVPAENVVGELGRGHVVAFNILNVGRFKLAAAAMGSAQLVLETALGYAAERKQFGVPLTYFGAIQAKLAEMAAQTYVAESVVYRTAGLMEEGFRGLDLTGDCRKEAGKALEEYAIECSLNKVLASEVLDFVADEGVQIHGGYGFIQEYPIERMYRDSRINRIFEGTNEINRLLVPGTLLKRAMSGELPLLQAAQAVGKELLSASPAGQEEGLGGVLRLVQKGKKLFLMAAGLAAQREGNALKDNQFVLMALAEMVLQIYAAESAVLRAMKLEGLEVQAKHKLFAAKASTLAAYTAFNSLEQQAKEVICAVEKGDAQATALAGVKKLARRANADLIGLRRELAAMTVEQGKYPLR